MGLGVCSIASGAGSYGGVLFDRQRGWLLRGAFCSIASGGGSYEGRFVPSPAGLAPTRGVLFHRQQGWLLRGWWFGRWSGFGFRTAGARGFECGLGQISVICVNFWTFSGVSSRILLSFSTQEWDFRILEVPVMPIFRVLGWPVRFSQLDRVIERARQWQPGSLAPILRMAVVRRCQSSGSYSGALPVRFAGLPSQRRRRAMPVTGSRVQTRIRRGAALNRAAQSE